MMPTVTLTITRDTINTVITALRKEQQTARESGDTLAYDCLRQAEIDIMGAKWINGQN